MRTLQKWIMEHGTEGRRKLFAALKEHFPNFTQTSLTQYIKGTRFPDLDKAVIISCVTGIALMDLSWRYVHKERSKISQT